MGESVEEEVRFHLDTRIEALIREGRSPEEAREEALAGFGDPDLVVERCRRIDERGARRRAWTDLLTDTLRDTKVALRALRKAKGYAAVTALSLAVGIGVSACLFTAVHAVWLAPVPGVTNQERIVDPVIVDGGFELWGWTYPDFLAVREAETPFEAWAAWNEADATIGLEGEVSGAERIHVAYASAEYFQVLGAQPVMGRGFLPSEDAGAGQAPVAVVGHEFWQTRLGGRPDVLGQSITLNRVPFTVVGVAPEGFRGARVTLATIDLWMPLSRNPALLGPSPFTEDHERFSVQVLGRLRPGATLSQAQAALGTVFARLAAERPETHQDRAVRAASFGRFPAQNRMGDLVAVAGLWGLVGVLLLIICGNLAGMTLARSASREKEIGVRLALGSSRPALVRALMVEAFLLALVGGGAGTVLAMVGMATLSPADLGVQAPGVTFEPSGWVLALSFALALLAALTFGLVPALRFTRPELVSALKDETGGGGRRVGRIQRFATSAQAGVALSLLVVGALFLRSLSRTDERALGFQPAGLVVTDYRTSSLSSGLLDLSAEGYPSLDQGGAPGRPDWGDQLAGRCGCGRACRRGASGSQVELRAGGGCGRARRARREGQGGVHPDHRGVLPGHRSPAPLGAGVPTERQCRFRGGGDHHPLPGGAPLARGGGPGPPAPLVRWNGGPPAPDRGGGGRGCGRQPARPGMASCLHPSPPGLLAAPHDGGPEQRGHVGPGGPSPAGDPVRGPGAPPGALPFGQDRGGPGDPGATSHRPAGRRPWSADPRPLRPGGARDRGPGGDPTHPGDRTAHGVGGFPREDRTPGAGGRHPSLRPRDGGGRSGRRRHGSRHAVHAPGAESSRSGVVPGRRRASPAGGPARRPDTGPESLGNSTASGPQGGVAACRPDLEPVGLWPVRPARRENPGVAAARGPHSALLRRTFC